MAEFQAKLKITLQPQHNHRFRYPSETGTHGVLNGRHRTQDFPEIELEVPSQSYETELYAITNLYKPTKSFSAECPELAPELLVERAKKSLSYGPVVGQMKRINESNVYTFSLTNCYIVRQKKDEIMGTLKKKYEEMEKFISGENELNLNQRNEIEEILQSERLKEQQLKQVCLGFSVYTKDKNGGYNLFCKPILSEPINNDKDIQIVRLCNIIAKYNDYVTVLVSEAKNDEVEIYLYEVKDCNFEENARPNILWSHTIKGGNLAIHKQAAIIFNMPEYTGETKDERITLRLAIKRPKHGDESPFVTILYERDVPDSGNPAKKRKLPSASPSSALDGLFGTWHTDSKKARNFRRLERNIRPKSLPEAVQIQRNIKELEKRLEENPDNWENVFSGDSANKNESHFYDAIEFDQFTNLHSMIQKLSLQSFAQKMRNSQQESLLHYACKLNKSKVLKPLIDMGCEVNALDSKRHIPLHLAIVNNNQDCINIFESLFKDAEPDEHLKLEENLKKMLVIYDEQGFTILHKAVFNNQLKLVQSILGFCKKKKIHSDRYEVLGSGDTILHLAASKGLKEMAQIIYKHDPQTIFYRNYAGNAIIEDDEIMRQFELESEL